MTVIPGEMAFPKLVGIQGCAVDVGQPVSFTGTLTPEGASVLDMLIKAEEFDREHPPANRHERRRRWALRRKGKDVSP